MRTNSHLAPRESHLGVRRRGPVRPSAARIPLPTDSRFLSASRSAAVAPSAYRLWRPSLSAPILATFVPLCAYFVFLCACFVPLCTYFVPLCATFVPFFATFVPFFATFPFGFLYPFPFVLLVFALVQRRLGHHRAGHRGGGRREYPYEYSVPWEYSEYPL